MSVKYFLLVLVAIVLVQATTAAPNRKKREGSVVEDTGKTISEMIDRFKNDADALLRNIQKSEIYNDLSDALIKFKDVVKKEATNLMEKVQTNN